MTTESVALAFCEQVLGCRGGESWQFSGQDASLHLVGSDEPAEPSDYEDLGTVMDAVRGWLDRQHVELEIHDIYRRSDDFGVQ